MHVRHLIQSAAGTASADVRHWLCVPLPLLYNKNTAVLLLAGAGPILIGCAPPSHCFIAPGRRVSCAHAHRPSMHSPNHSLHSHDLHVHLYVHVHVHACMRAAWHHRVAAQPPEWSFNCARVHVRRHPLCGLAPDRYGPPLSPWGPSLARCPRIPRHDTTANCTLPARRLALFARHPPHVLGSPIAAHTCQPWSAAVVCCECLRLKPEVMLTLSVLP